MKPGSIVVVLPLPDFKPTPNDGVKWLPITDERTPYVIRQFDNSSNCGTPCATFEEGCIGHHPTTHEEYAWDARYLREIAPPEDISNFIEEMMCEPVTH